MEIEQSRVITLVKYGNSFRLYCVNYTEIIYLYVLLLKNKIYHQSKLFISANKSHIKFEGKRLDITD